MSAITLATNDSYGVVKGDAATAYKVNVDADSTMSVNQLPELAASVATIGSQVNGLATSKANVSSLAAVATSGSYNDLSNKPTIPTIPVTSVAGKTGAVTLAKADVGLSNVDNTSDANKSVSTAQQAALDTKIDISSGINGINVIAYTQIYLNTAPAAGAKTLRIYGAIRNFGVPADSQLGTTPTSLTTTTVDGTNPTCVLTFDSDYTCTIPNWSTDVFLF